MGQYWLPVNITKKQFIHPHKLGAGLKLWEQVYSDYVGKALLVLCAAHREVRGGGDIRPLEGEKMHPAVGMWAGDKIALVGDYAEKDDLPPLCRAEEIYGACRGSEEEVPKGDRQKLVYTDVTDTVLDFFNRYMDVVFEGDGWKRPLPKDKTQRKIEDMVDKFRELVEDAVADSTKPKNEEA